MGNVLYMRKGLIHESPVAIDPHTLLLLHGESITDSSMYHVPLTNSGVVVSEGQSKFGGRSLYFDGKSHIEFPQESIIYGNGDFTFDWWEYCENNIGCRFSSSAFNQSDLNKKGLMVGNNGTGVRVSATGVNFDLDAENMLSSTNSQWVHWACVRHSGTIKTYRNGNLYKSEATPDSLTVYQGSNKFPQTIGTQRLDRYFFAGFIDEFRISNIARWTSNFTPPTEPYPG